MSDPQKFGNQNDGGELHDSGLTNSQNVQDPVIETEIGTYQVPMHQSNMGHQVLEQMKSQKSMENGLNMLKDKTLGLNINGMNGLPKGMVIPNHMQNVVGMHGMGNLQMQGLMGAMPNFKKNPRKRKINKLACEYCSKLHKKCDGNYPNPCSRCLAKGITCSYVRRQKRGPKAKRIKTSNKPSTGVAKQADLTQQMLIYPPTFQNNFNPVFQNHFIQSFLQNPQNQQLLQGQHNQNTNEVRENPPTIEQVTTENPQVESGESDSAPEEQEQPEQHVETEKPITDEEDDDLNKVNRVANPDENMNTGDDEDDGGDQMEPVVNVNVNPNANRNQEIQQQFVQNNVNQNFLSSVSINSFLSNLNNQLREDSGDIVTCKVVLCVTGSVAAIKIPQLTQLFTQRRTKIHIKLKTNHEGGITVNSLVDDNHHHEQVNHQQNQKNSISNVEEDIVNVSINTLTNQNPTEDLGMNVDPEVSSVVDDVNSITKTIIYEVKVVLSQKSLEFLSIDELKNKTGISQFFLDGDDFGMWKGKGDPVVHIELRKWADIMLIAPLSSNTLAKLANGLCDNLITCIAKAWDFSQSIVVAPAMNTFMWLHPFTQKHVNTLKNELGYHFVDPIEKLLACNEKGIGALADVNDIVDEVERKFIEQTFDKSKFDVSFY